jgi:GTPase Era involved in 16S rRNA processing
MFYDDMESRALEDPGSDRDAEIPLPGPDEGYARVQLVGTTGAGKTTLLRQLIGTDPKKDRFPSTSTAKTTTFDIEIICGEGPYRAAVSFLSREHVRLYIEECVIAAGMAAAEGETESMSLRRLLEHNDQRFRLSYVLGTLRASSQEDADEDSEEIDELVDEDTEEEDDTDDSEAVEISAEERKQMEARLRSFLDRAIELGKSVYRKSAETLEVTIEELSPEESDTFIDLVEQSMREDEDTQLLIDEMLEEVETRFSFLEDRNLKDDSWPKVWTYESTDRVAFIKTINRLSSNYAPNFGRLLTPLVQGIRVWGPFRPEWYENGGPPKLVVIDGEGLGHAPDSAFSLPTSVTKRYEKVDAILLVDNSTQPMQAGAQAVLRSVAVSGHGSKLAVVFTHFDQVKGDNLPNISAKKNHVSASLNNAVSGLEQVFGEGVSRTLRRNLEGRVFFVSNIQEKLSPGARFTRKELAHLVETMRSAIEPVEVGEAVPVYDLANLVLSVRKANEQFNDYWMARLKLRYKTGIDAEHWTRIKALSRRFAEQWRDYYDNLRPVADMIRFTSEAMTTFINSPRIWKGPEPTEEDRQQKLGRVAQEFFSRLHDLAHQRLFLEHVAEWSEAFERTGRGSTLERARDIRYIYEDAAPIPGEAPDTPANKLLDSVRQIFVEAVEAAGAEFVSVSLNAP